MNDTERAKAKEWYDYFKTIFDWSSMEEFALAMYEAGLKDSPKKPRPIMSVLKFPQK